jgi:hypothetical protein
MTDTTDHDKVRARAVAYPGIISPSAKPMTDLEAFTAIWDDIPGTPDEWSALALRADLLKAKSQNADARGGKFGGGDGTINSELWGHLRNVTRALKEMAWSLSSAERGDDPDIPF